MKLKPNRLSSLVLAVSVAAVLGACGGGDALPPGATPLTAAPDKTPPTLAMSSSSAGATATGEVTFTFTFSENVGTSFTADDVVVIGGAKGAFATPSGTTATLVVVPNASSTGTLELSVAAARFSDLAGNLNAAATTLSQPFNTVAPVGSGKTGACTAAPCTDFSAAGIAAVSFGGLSADVVNDPGDATNKVLRMVKNPAAETWAGTTIDPSGTGVATVPSIGFGTSKIVTLRMLSPAAGQTIMLKVENASDSAVFMEATAVTTKVNQWETLSFNYTTPSGGAYDASKTYNRVSVFPSFGTKVTASTTFYADELSYSAAAGVASTNLVSFDVVGTVYTLTGFGGAEDATVVNDPTGGTNKVAKIVKSGTAELWAGTTMSTGANQSIATVAFTASAKTMTLRVYATAAGIPIRLKLENAADPTQSVETEATTTTANAWQTLSFNFANQAAGTAALNLAFTYNKASVFPNFGKTGAQGGGGTWYFDDLSLVGVAVTPPTSSTTALVTFDAVGTTYMLTGFGGAEDATVVVDPTGGTNKVAKIVKSGTAELWAGATMSTGANMTIAVVPFTATDKTMTLRVYAVAAGIPVRLKLENAADPTKSVETEATTTAANAWQTLSFNFANQAAGTAALNLATTYNKASVFPNFGKTGAQGGGGTWYVDDLSFVGGSAGGSGTAGTATALISFDAVGVVYTLTGFGGAEDATVVNDPTGGTNKVAKIVKSATAELWAGTTLSTGANQSIATVALSASAKTLTLRVYATASGIPIRLKLENAADPTQSVETEATTTTANAWQTLSFNFANQAAGTAALNLAFTYNKASVFPNFGRTGAQGGGGTWYFDDLSFTP